MDERANRPAPQRTRGNRSASKKQSLPLEIQKQIGRQLRSLYVDVVQEGVPDRFTDLLRRLDEQDLSNESKS
jgi:Anti-sigma factor NepR